MLSWSEWESGSEKLADVFKVLDFRGSLSRAPEVSFSRCYETVLGEGFHIHFLQTHALRFKVRSVIELVGHVAFIRPLQLSEYVRLRNHHFHAQSPSQLCFEPNQAPEIPKPSL